MTHEEAEVLCSLGSHPWVYLVFAGKIPYRRPTGWVAAFTPPGFHCNIRVCPICFRCQCFDYNDEWEDKQTDKKWFDEISGEATFFFRDQETLCRNLGTSKV